MNNANTGFFQWIREGVRRSVLLGFSDAVEQLGAPTDSNDVSPHLLAVLRQNGTALPAPESDASRPAARNDRKRLGRSLDQIRESTAKDE
jgi:hypothetical protein